MRHSRGTGPPSTQSGSSASGRGLVRGSHRDRGPHIPGVMVPGDPEKEPSKNRTKVIIILGIALPVLACIIGIIAWSVTTDVLRISPRPHDSAFNQYGHQGKTRIDSMQPRNDEDIDIFQLHSISSTATTVPSVLVKVIAQKTQPKQTITPTRGNIIVEPSTESPKVSDIISRLISDMPIPKNPKNFVVFAPVADDPIPIKKRRFDGKALVHDAEDLVAEESAYSEEISQDTHEHKLPSSRTRKSSREISYLSKTDGIHSQNNKHPHLKQNKDDISVWESTFVKSNSQFNQNPIHSEMFQLKNKHISSSTNKKSSGFVQSNPIVTHAENTNEFKSNDNLNIASQPTYQQVQPNHNLKDSKKLFNYQPTPSNSPTNPSSFRNEDKNRIQNNKNPALQTDGRNAVHQLATYQNQHLSGINQGQISPTQNYQSPSHHLLNPQQIHSSPQQLYNSPSQQSQNSPQQIQKPPHHYHHATLDERPKMALSSFQSHVQSPSQQSSHVSPLHSSSNQGLPSRNAYSNNPDYASGSYPVDNGYQSSSNGPQYFAPPPQTFHTKTSYDYPSNKFGASSSLSTYEKSAQVAADQSKDGLHHHHHHHHHHDPIPSNSDPIGDINLSDVPRTNDADRLGTIGVGLGGPGRRGITVQIGGGGGGGGLTGLLPLGALGIAKNIVASLLPRPSIGLNSKVFLGVEVGRGGGMGGMGGGLNLLG